MDAVWLEDGQLSVRQVDRPSPPAGEALVRVQQAGICNTDLELIAGYYPFRGVLGHEFVGIVEEGPLELLRSRVVGEINAVCSDCVQCRSDRSTHCDRRTVLRISGRNGAFAQFLTLPIANLHIVPGRVSDDAAVLLEPLAAAPLVVDEITLIGSRCGPFPPALERLAPGHVEVEDLIETRYPLSESETAFERAARPGKLRILLDIG